MFQSFEMIHFDCISASTRASAAMRGHGGHEFRLISNISALNSYIGTQCDENFISSSNPLFIEFTLQTFPASIANFCSV